MQRQERGVRLSTGSEFAGRTVLVCGVAFAGEAAARALLARGATVLLTDRRITDAVAPLEAAGAKFLGDLDALPPGVDLLWVTPGLPPSHPLPIAALSAGIEVIGEIELAWRLRDSPAAPWLAVTGTNGKTTTVRMLESILQAAGLRAAAVGNVGVSIIDAVTASGRHDVLAVELSSYQLHWSSTIEPAAGALLNLAPDHLDWHGSMGGYALTKTKVWDTPVAIGNLDDEYVARLLEGAESRAQGRKVGFTLSAPRPGQLGVADGMLVDHAFSHDPVELIAAAQITPTGSHNVANALAAAALARAHGVDAAAVRDGLRGFEPDPHRNQLVADRGGVRYVDDSKATNPHAALASVLSYGPIVWIAGGQLKNAPVDDLVVAAAPRLRAVVLLGADRAVIRTALARHAPEIPVIEVARTDDGAMTEVVGTAAGLARPGDTVLLAPAGASYDMFAGYAARGAAFTTAIDALPAP
jgi:UDP-N-acetylmuramoylalanine--D-glutamate ligase